MGRGLTRRTLGLLAAALLSTAISLPANIAMAQSATAQSTSGSELILLQCILAQVGATGVINAHFVQTRTSPLLTTPAVTQGSLVFAREHGVIWQVHTPQPQGYVYGRERNARLDAEGNVLSLDSQRSPITQQINEWTSAFMRGDTSGLASQFAITTTGTLSHWSVTLMPTQPQIAQAVSRLTLTGDTVIRRVLLETRRGESVKWDFDKVRTTDKLDAREQRIFRAVE
ncbi:LolA family protein [Pandoraea oxalativorans]|uniref:Outer membrane lipoprotein carrier protein LolA n=1 Tax=Pandoraea oxalativorans TaxID=573737 RepID=A0A0E3U7M7_9BURK|nr:outer membrane lipoprotein carrier protein LolA [Pandoraea oxalativorans]AKC70999.1 hypothetical protein MB84_18255 [Pandoraea oxalativorans]